MNTVADIFEYLNQIAPVETQESYDNAGLLFGNRFSNVTKALLALDITCEVIEEAAMQQVQLIITHHPLIFGKLQHIWPEEPTGKRILALANKQINVISMHTNLDKAEGGVNDVLIQKFAVDYVEHCEELPYMRIGVYENAIPFSDFLINTKSALKSNGLRYVANGRDVKKIACIGGAGDDGLMDAYRSGCDTFITSDVHYHVFLEAKELEMNLIDADHFCTENPVIEVLQKRLSNAFPDVDFILSNVHKQTAQFI